MPFTYKCDEYKRCIREDVINADLESVMSLGECKLTCSKSSVLWPLPREFKLGKSVVPFNLRDIQFSNEESFAVRYYKRFNITTFTNQSYRLIRAMQSTIC